ncbi:hypothetical protein [Streptomyces sp. NPDC058451]|uniref:hypothetical protein n=1 Tax=Streptomyces sp. NPDC058451 TaxID=3346506 RepID=UPI003658D248
MRAGTGAGGEQAPGRLDGARVRTALLDLVVQHGVLLRRRGQAAQALTLALQP